MASTLKVNTIQHTGGTTGLTIDSSGRVLQPNVVAWFVNKTSTQTASGAGELITFDTVKLNQGSGFQTSGGNANKFVAPVHGIYTTSATLLTINDTNTHDCRLIHNSTILVRFRNSTQDSNAHESFGFTWVGELNASDTLHLEIVTSGRAIYGDSSAYAWSMWCGHLLG